MATIVDHGRRVDELVDAVEPRFRRRFREAVAALKEEWRLSEIELLIAVGRIEQALVRAQVLALPLADEWRRAYVVAGDAAASLMADRTAVTVSFDVSHHRAVQALAENRLRLVRELTEEQGLALREAVSEGVARGLSQRATARLFRDSLGLTQRQVQAVENYRRLLERGSSQALERALRDRRFDRSLQRAVGGGRPLTKAQIDRMVERYRERYLTYRSETIARTEALSALHAGTEQLYAQAIADGTIAPDELTREWLPRLDGRERPSHRAMRGQRRAIGEPFVSGDGYLLRYPGDELAPASDRVNCRCAVTVRYTVDLPAVAPA